MDQPQPYIFDGIYYENKKRVRTPSPIFKTCQQNKKIKKDTIIKRTFSESTNLNNLKCFTNKKMKCN
tara:strand:+ start:339 stop:539 length:201 start_codon:yes stop_codon:yes gene_type:complete